MDGYLGIYEVGYGKGKEGGRVGYWVYHVPVNIPMIFVAV